MSNDTLPEEWRPVIGFEGQYDVSNLGRVRSLPRRDNLGRRIRGRILRQARSTSGYWQVCLAYAGTVKYQQVHRMVLESFCGECPSGMEGCHGDGDRSNNRLSNLRWDTRSHNHQDKRAHGTLVWGEAHPRSTLTSDDVVMMFELWASGLKQWEIAKRFGMSRSGVQKILSRGSWRALYLPRHLRNIPGGRWAARG